MVHWNGMLGLVRFRMLRAGISKYSTERLASRSGLWAASRAIPTSAITIYSLFLRQMARGFVGDGGWASGGGRVRGQRLGGRGPEKGGLRAGSVTDASGAARQGGRRDHTGWRHR